MIDVGLADRVSVGAPTCATVIGVGQAFTGVIVGTDDWAKVDVIVTSAVSLAPMLSVTVRRTWVVEPGAGAGTVVSAAVGLLITAVPAVTAH